MIDLEYCQAKGSHSLHAIHRQGFMTVFVQTTVSNNTLMLVSGILQYECTLVIA